MRFLTWLVLFVLLCVRSGSCCGSLSSAPEGKIAIARESAVIVWDEKTHTEHFIRSADFRTDQTSIGFLVPTPTPPMLAPTNGAAFSLFEDEIRPQVIIRDIPVYIPIPFMFIGGTAGSKLGDINGCCVDVLSQGKVGDYDTAVLRADDTTALTHWLSRHGFVSRSAIQEWLRPYVLKHWTITAFKIDHRDTANHGLALSPIRMSFHADHPFYPYSEPSDASAKAGSAPGRLLRLFVLSNTRMSGTLEGTGVHWPGETVWANPWNKNWTGDDSDISLLHSSLGIPKTALTSCRWMTVFEDRSSPRPGIADLVFTPSETQEDVTPKPETQYKVKYVQVPIEPILLVTYLLYLYIRKRRATRSRQNDPSVAL